MATSLVPLVGRERLLGGAGAAAAAADQADLDGAAAGRVDHRHEQASGHHRGPRRGRALEKITPGRGGDETPRTIWRARVVEVGQSRRELQSRGGKLSRGPCFAWPTLD